MTTDTEALRQRFEALVSEWGFNVYRDFDGEYTVASTNAAWAGYLSGHADGVREQFARQEPQLAQQQKSYEAEIAIEKEAAYKEGHAAGVAAERERAANIAADLAADACVSYANGEPVNFRSTVGDAIRKSTDAERERRVLMPPLRLSGHQVKQALEFLNAIDCPQNLDDEVCIAHRPAGIDMDGEPHGAGLVCWLSEHPEEGSYALDVIRAGEAKEPTP